MGKQLRCVGCSAIVAWVLMACDDGGDASTSQLPTDELELLHEACVDFTNERRASLGLPALNRWVDAENCSDSQSSDDQNGAGAHGSFGACGERAQNTCPGWAVDTSSAARIAVIEDCLQMMWNEGPGEPYSAHGHFINMSSTEFGSLACGVSLDDGRLWVNMNFR